MLQIHNLFLSLRQQFSTTGCNVFVHWKNSCTMVMFAITVTLSPNVALCFPLLVVPNLGTVNPLPQGNWNHWIPPLRGMATEATTLLGLCCSYSKCTCGLFYRCCSCRYLRFFFNTLPKGSTEVQEGIGALQPPPPGGLPMHLNSIFIQSHILLVSHQKQRVGYDYIMEQLRCVGGCRGGCGPTQPSRASATPRYVKTFIFAFMVQTQRCHCCHHLPASQILTSVPTFRVMIENYCSLEMYANHSLIWKTTMRWNSGLHWQGQKSSSYVVITAIDNQAYYDLHNPVPGLDDWSPQIVIEYWMSRTECWKLANLSIYTYTAICPSIHTKSDDIKIPSCLELGHPLWY